MVHNRIPLIDDEIELKSKKFITYTYKIVQVRTLVFLNYVNQCPKRYEIGVIKNVENKSCQIYSSQTILLSELQHIKQTEVNINFPNYINDEEM